MFSNIGAGDVVQYAHFKNGETYHSQIVHRKSTGEEGTNTRKVSVAQHISNGWNNLRTYINALANPNGNDLAWVTVIRLNSSTTW